MIGSDIWSAKVVWSDAPDGVDKVDDVARDKNIIDQIQIKEREIIWKTWRYLNNFQRSC